MAPVLGRSSIRAPFPLCERLPPPGCSADFCPDGLLPPRSLAPKGFPAPLPRRDIPATVLALAILFQRAPGADPLAVLADYFRGTPHEEPEVRLLPFRKSANPTPAQDDLWRHWGHLALFAREGGQVAHVGLWRIQQELESAGEAPLRRQDVAVVGRLPTSRARRRAALALLAVGLPGPTLGDLWRVVREAAEEEWARLHTGLAHPRIHRHNGMPL